MKKLLLVSMFAVSVAACSMPRGASSVDTADAGFMKKAAENGHAEIAASQLASSKASSPAVRQFAAQMITDHTRANSELSRVAAAKGVELPQSPSLLQRADAKLLETMDGDSFDKRYMSKIGVSAHEETVELFQKFASGASDRDVKALAQKSLPVFQHHLDMARQLNETVQRR